MCNKTLRLYYKNTFFLLFNTNFTWLNQNCAVPLVAKILSILDPKLLGFLSKELVYFRIAGQWMEFKFFIPKRVLLTLKQMIMWRCRFNASDRCNLLRHALSVNGLSSNKIIGRRYNDETQILFLSHPSLLMYSLT